MKDLCISKMEKILLCLIVALVTGGTSILQVSFVSGRLETKTLTHKGT